MKSFSILSAFNISSFSFEKLKNGISAFDSACNLAANLPHCEKVIVLCSSKNEKDIAKQLIDINMKTGSSSNVEIETQVIEEFTSRAVFKIARDFATKNENFKHVFFLHGDTPFYDLELSRQLFDQHIEYGAEYSFVDGYPEGLAPEIIAAGLCAILHQVTKDSAEPISRNFIFETVKKEINNYDIETIIAPHDLRHLRLQFICNNKRNTELCNRFIGINAGNYAEFIEDKKEDLFTYPAYYAIEINDSNLLKSIYNPLRFTKKDAKGQMNKDEFFTLVDKIADFSDDAIISLSILGEPALHNEIVPMIEKILSYPKLSVLIETSGLNWSNETIEEIEKILKQAKERENGMFPLYWIVSIDAVSSAMYAKVHSLNEDDANKKLKEAVSFTDKINKIFTNSVWAQIIRMNENEVEVEPFYRFWKEVNAQVIIQKFDSFCKTMEDKRVADLSPFYRHPCWHLKRDLYIMSDGRVPMCREDLYCKKLLGNAFTDSFQDIRKKAFEIYKEHLSCNYGGACGACDEYYTYNF